MLEVSVICSNTNAVSKSCSRAESECHSSWHGYSQTASAVNNHVNASTLSTLHLRSNNYAAQEPFVDFVKSDLQGRAMLIKAAFDLFTIMQRRAIQVSQLLGARTCCLFLCVLVLLAGDWPSIIHKTQGNPHEYTSC